MSHLLDEDGNIYEPGFGGQWHSQQGIFGQNKDTNLFGQPNLQRDLLGRPVVASARSVDGRTLYKPVPESYSSSSSSFGDALAGAAAVFIVIFAFMALGALISIMVKVVEALLEFWQDLHRRYPRQMLVLKLSFGMIAIFSILYLAGFSWQIQVSAALLIPGLWGWLWLTRHLSLVFMPINMGIMGAVLWIVATLWQNTWQPTWSRLAQGIPLVNNLSLLLAVSPMITWFWYRGVKRWPQIFRPLNALVLGASLWFLLMRIWDGWQPFWMWWTEPVSILNTMRGWLILILPLVLWLWFEGQSRWPYPFTAMNLLLLGGVFSLSAYHNQNHWVSTWQHWMTGLPFLGFPLLTISLTPVTLWGWSKASQRWHHQLAFPNALITGAILFLLLDRTRIYWSHAWMKFWGPVPLEFDPAIFLLILPPIRWGWKVSVHRWPQYAWIGRSLLLGALLWWLVERTSSLWQMFWLDINVIGKTDPAFIIAITPIALQIWWKIHHRWPKQVGIPSLAALIFFLWLLIGWLSPLVELSFRVAYVLLPLSIALWLWLLKRRPIITIVIGLLPWAVIITLVIIFPQQTVSILKSFLYWLARQILPGL